MFPAFIQKIKTLRIRNGLGKFSDLLDQNRSKDLNLETLEHWATLMSYISKYLKFPDI